MLPVRHHDFIASNSPFIVQYYIVYLVRIRIIQASCRILQLSVNLRIKYLNMKKLFSKIETRIDNTAKEPNSYVGKVFVVGRMTVTVEEVLAEG